MSLPPMQYVVSALAVLLVSGSVAGDMALAHRALDSSCGTCARSARTDLLVTGLMSAMLWPVAWAVAREVASGTARAVVLCGGAALCCWAVAAGMAFGWLPLG